MYFSDLNGDGVVQLDPEKGEVLQEAHYYPFGMNMDGPWVMLSSSPKPQPPQKRDFDLKIQIHRASNMKLRDPLKYLV